MSTSPEVLVSVHRASRLGDQVVPRTTILVDNVVPSGGVLSEMRAAFDRDAQSIAVSLQGSLPGGTLDRLLIKIMEIKVRTSARWFVEDVRVDPVDALESDLARAITRYMSQNMDLSPLEVARRLGQSASTVQGVLARGSGRRE